MNPKHVSLIERAKRAVASHPDDPRTPALVAEARNVLDDAQGWQDVTPITNYEG